MIIAISIFIIADIVLLASLARNMRERDMMKRYGQVKQAEVRGWKQIPGRPTRYAIKVCYGYDMAGNEKTKWKITSGKFGKNMRENEK